MVEQYNISIDSEPFATNFWYAGITEYLGKEYPFTIMIDDDGSVLQITWTEEQPTDDSEILQTIEKDIESNF